MVGTIEVSLQWGIKPRDFPTLQMCQLCSNVAILPEYKNNNWLVTIRIVSRLEIQELNRTYRNKDCPTNILSFSYDSTNFVHDESEKTKYLGDLAICYSIMDTQCIEQNKSRDSHWSHIIIHGILHLQGMHHVEKKSAKKMEDLEIKLLNSLGLNNPYV